MHLWIQCMVIRASRDQLAFDQSPGLIAVFHALHRLPAPRHPPHALTSLAALILSSAAVSNRRKQNNVQLVFPCCFAGNKGEVTILLSLLKALLRISRETAQ